MAKAVSNIRKTQTAHSWGILLGMLGFPVLALLSKVLPQFDMAWEVLLVVSCLVVVRSAVGFLFPGAGASAKKADQAATQAR